MTTIVPLRQIAEVSAGQGAPQGEKHFGRHGYPFVRAGSLELLIGDGTEDSLEKISDQTARKFGLRLYPKGTILFAKSGMSATKDRVYVLKLPCYVVSHLAAIIPKRNDDSKFLKFWFKRFRPSTLIRDRAYPSIRLSDIEEIEIPDLEDTAKKRIVFVLDKCESAAAKRKEASRLTDEFLKSVFLEMFGDPARNPKGWEVKTVGELMEDNILECLDSKRIPLKESDRAKRRGDIPYYGANGLIDYIDDFIFDKHLLLLAEDGGYWGPFEKSSYRISGKSWVNNHAHVLKATDEALLYYLEHFLNVADLRNYISGTTRGKLTQSDMRRIKVSFPDSIEQQKFADIVQKVEKLKEKQRESEKELDNLFNSLMQRAFRKQGQKRTLIK